MRFRFHRSKVYVTDAGREFLMGDWNMEANVFEPAGTTISRSGQQWFCTKDVRVTPKFRPKNHAIEMKLARKVGPGYNGIDLIYVEPQNVKR